MNKGPTIPKTKPPNLKSFCSSFPVLYAMALGGVDMGKKRAVEAQKPITRGNTMGF